MNLISPKSAGSMNANFCRRSSSAPETAFSSPQKISLPDNHRRKSGRHPFLVVIPLRLHEMNECIDVVKKYKQAHTHLSSFGPCRSVTRCQHTDGGYQG